MEISKNELKILELLKVNLFLKASIREIMQKINSKSYQRIYDAVEKLVKKKVLVSKKIGNSNVCEINLSKETISLLSFIEKEEAFKRKIPHIDKILEFDSLLDDIIIVAGSYAKGTQTKKSDIDLAIITKEEIVHKQKLIENQTMLFIPQIHVIVFGYNDFKEMLLSKEPDFGKEVFKNHLIFRNAERYYLLVREAISNGFGMENLS